jgi:hypothetical protein
MKSFSEFIAEAGQYGAVNLAFEGGMYSLVNELERIVQVFRESGIAFEFVGGVAVNAHVLATRRSRSFLTRDIDLLMHESDLGPLLHSAAAAGYEGRKIMGSYALLLPDQDLEEAVHVSFVGKKPRSSYPAPNPPLRPEEKTIYGLNLPVAPVRDLLLMKLNSVRDEDKVQMQILEQVRLITPEIVSALPVELQARLDELRDKWRNEDREVP